MDNEIITQEPAYVVPFKHPLAYFKEILKGDPANINQFPQLHLASGWDCNCDLHWYPYVHARPGLLSVGCKNNCFFCRTAEEFKGRVYYGDYSKILANYEDEEIHFMDEDFFSNPSMDRILPILKERRIVWLALTTYKNFLAALDKYGEDYLYECGMRTVELGLENVVLCRKVETHIPLKKIRIYYLNLTGLPGETKETIRENAAWMKPCSMADPVNYHNGQWYCPGLFFYPIKPPEGGRYVRGEYALTRPTWMANSLLNQDYCITDMAKVNYYCQLMYGTRMFPKNQRGNVGEYIFSDSTALQQDRALWMLVGMRVGGLV